MSHWRLRYASPRAATVFAQAKPPGAGHQDGTHYRLGPRAPAKFVKMLKGTARFGSFRFHRRKSARHRDGAQNQEPVAARRLAAEGR